ncbi:TonB-dependent receptor [Chryseolinea lacunae]|uniref:TonB-dependent receptor n=1 Tax=Chryseolinea lacunae TaxID=2801331 RepID=A0ABS1KXC5_9BACT|nr:TonB-dependent receptor [Chryseolinea lacunae]MBL0743862.1 TonB-dependent receptor [Chryseolinea lacunae]
MKKFYKHLLASAALLLLGVTATFAQTTVSGKVTDGVSGEGLAGVNIVVKGRVIGTITDTNGAYSLKVNDAPPFTLTFSFVGYRTQEIDISNAATSGLDVKLEEQTVLGQEIVVSASRVEESILQSPVSIEKMDILGVQSTASENYYKGLINMKGLDMTQSSVNFQIINARGFNSTGNTRFVQLTDGMDTQAPALNFPIGNLNGPSELDVESVEFIPGSASALYGPNAFNGILLVNSKNPFEYQGLSAFAKYGMNHIGDADLNTEGQGKIGPGSAQPMWEGAIRYAKAFNNRFAFKVALSYSKATDWYGTNLKDKNTALNAGYATNPGSDQVHAFGDEVATNIGLLGLNPAFQTQVNSMGLGAYLGDIPNDVVSRTPYREQYLVDYNAHNFKANLGLNYRITDKIELLYALNYGSGTSVYTGAQRYSLKDFSIQQHKLELRGSNFFLRGYTTIENSGDSYIADLTGVLINRAWKADTQWFGEYTANYLGYLAQNGIAPGAATLDNRNAAHLAARAAADVGRYLPGTQQFEDAKNAARSKTIPNGSLFDDKTSLYHLEGQYNFKNQIDFMDLMIGASYRLYDLNSNGTIFADTAGNNITIQEVGAYVQAAKKFFADKVKLTGSLRYDKNENFDGLINPRISGVYSPTPNHNFRASFQSGFRNPTTQGQHINLDVLTYRLLGGLPEYAKAYNIFQNAYTVESVNRYAAIVAQKAGKGPYAGGNAGLAIGDPEALKQLTPITDAKPVTPEKVKAIEVGYKGLLGDKLMIDLTYYHNSYNNFITQVILRQSAGPLDLNATAPTEQNVRNAQTLLTPGTDASGRQNSYSAYTNLSKKVTAQGAAIGMEYSLPKGYKVGANYNWNKLNDQLGDGYLSEFNTPEHKFNVTFGNRKVTERLGFNLAYRWQQSFLWEATFAQGTVPSVGLMDAQVSYKVKPMKCMFKLGGSDIFNTRYVLNYGGPTLGAIYYVSVTFDQLMN